MWSEVCDIFRKKEPKPVLYRVTTWFKYEAANGKKGKVSYRGTLDWDMTGDENYILTVSMCKILGALTRDKIYPVAITSVSKEEYENIVPEN